MSCLSSPFAVSILPRIIQLYIVLAVATMGDNHPRFAHSFIQFIDTKMVDGSPGKVSGDTYIFNKALFFASIEPFLFFTLL